ncbi:hypothetical protein ACQVUC_13495 [Bacillus paranthracis]|uniref:hypothetical protein n=1 Tax=Bacillus paranthracis TaxID=2026186 RepID=UPI003D64D50D
MRGPVRKSPNVSTNNEWGMRNPHSLQFRFIHHISSGEQVIGIPKHRHPDFEETF